MIIKKIILTISIFISLSTIANASLKSKAWSLFVNTVTETAGNVLSNVIKEKITPENSTVLNLKIQRLEKELSTFSKSDTKPENFYRIQETIFGLKNMVSSLDTRVLSLEDKVNNLEHRLDIMNTNTSIINYTISKDTKNTLLNTIEPSFKCSKAKRTVELSICNNLVLRDIDGKLGKIYWELRHYFPKNISYQLKKEQLYWIKKRDKICNPHNIECLVDMYKLRINELQAKF